MCIKCCVTRPAAIFATLFSWHLIAQLQQGSRIIILHLSCTKLDCLHCEHDRKELYVVLSADPVGCACASQILCFFILGAIVSTQSGLLQGKWHHSTFWWIFFYRMPMARISVVYNVHPSADEGKFLHGSRTNLSLLTLLFHEMPHTCTTFCISTWQIRYTYSHCISQTAFRLF